MLRCYDIIIQTRNFLSHSSPNEKELVPLTRARHQVVSETQSFPTRLQQVHVQCVIINDCYHFKTRTGRGADRFFLRYYCKIIIAFSYRREPFIIWSFFFFLGRRRYNIVIYAYSVDIINPKTSVAEHASESVG